MEWYQKPKSDAECIEIMVKGGQDFCDFAIKGWEEEM